MRIDVSKVSVKDYKGHRLAVLLTEDQKIKLAAIARTRNLTMSRFMRNIVDQICDQFGDQALEELEHLRSSV